MINYNKLFVNTLDKQKELNELKLFKQFLDMFPKDISKEELIYEDNKLLNNSFEDLINKYYEVQ